MPYVIWLAYVIAIWLLDHLRIAEFLHKYLVTLSVGVVGLIGWLLGVMAYVFWVEKLGEDSGWRSALAFGLVFGPLMVIYFSS